MFFSTPIGGKRFRTVNGRGIFSEQQANPPAAKEAKYPKKQQKSSFAKQRAEKSPARLSHTGDFCTFGLDRLPVRQPLGEISEWTRYLRIACLL